MKERHWHSLVGALRRGQCVLVLGPDVPAAVASGSEGGASVDARLVDLLGTTLADELEADGRRVHRNGLAALAQQYEDAQDFGSAALRETVARFYASQTFRPSAVHEKLASLPFTMIVTTSQDRLMSAALTSRRKAPISQHYDFRGDKRANPEFFVPGSPEAPVVFHLFGSVENPWSLVLSENDILDFLIALASDRPPLPNSLLRALKTTGQSFLFLGFGIRRWDLRVPLKILLRTLALDRGSNAVAAESLKGLVEADRDDMILFYQRGTRVEVEDTELEPFLDELSRREAAEGGYVGQELGIGPQPRVFISYAREDGALAARVFDALQRAHFAPWLDREKLQGGEDFDQRIKSDLDDSDFAVVLYTPALCRKTDSYVNKEIELARERASRVRGSFLIPLKPMPIEHAQRIDELRPYQDMELRPEQFDQDMAKLISLMTRQFQLRNRER
jgi:hypothetical protein